MMRIAFISFEYFGLAQGGGIGTYVRFASEALASRGHSVAVFTSADHAQEKQLHNGVEIHSISSPRRDFAASIVPVFARHHDSRSFDLIEGPDYGAEASAVAKAFPGLPLVVRLHTPTSVINEVNELYRSRYSKARFIFGGLRRGVIPKPFWKYDPRFDEERVHAMTAAEITAPSNAILALLRERWSLPKEYLTKIPNPFVPSTSLLEIAAGSTTNRVTFFGRLEVRKGIVELSRAIPLVLKKMPGVKFRLIGRSLPHPNTGEDLRAYLVRRLGEHKAGVEFLDAVPYTEIPALLADSDICIFPSVWENSPFVCKEAMAAARGVIASNAGGMAEIIEHGHTGLLIPPRDPQALATTIIELLRNPDRRTALGQAARAHVTAAYAPEVIVPLQETIYARAIKRAHRNAPHSRKHIL